MVAGLTLVLSDLGFGSTSPSSINPSASKKSAQSMEDRSPSSQKTVLSEEQSTSPQKTAQSLEDQPLSSQKTVSPTDELSSSTQRTEQSGQRTGESAPCDSGIRSYRDVRGLIMG